MTRAEFRNGLARIGNAQIHYETAGAGTPFVMIHAGIADHRQWNNEFPHYADRFRVIRYDMRGFGKSEPVEGEFSDLTDLIGLLDHLGVEQPAILMGCSMGGGLALDFTLTHPERVRALILVGSAPHDLELDAEEDEEKFAAAEKAFEEGNLDLAAEIETQAWFDGAGRAPGQTRPDARRLAVEMNRTALGHAAKKLGKRTRDREIQAAKRLDEINAPTLIVVGALDNPYMQAAADTMQEQLPSARKVVIEDAAHLPNMDHPDLFRQAVDDFLERIDA